MAKKKDTWEAVTATLRSMIPPSEYQTWFSQLTPVEIKSRSATVEAPNKFVASWLQDRYLSDLQHAFQVNFNALPEIRFTYPNRTQSSGVSPRRNSSEATGLFPHLLFGRFVTAESNRFAFSCAHAVATGAESYNPLYIYGNSSSGKTHLLHAIGNHLLRKNPSASVRYLSHRELASRLSHIPSSRKPAVFRKEFQQLDCLLLDDIHLLEGKESLQVQLLSLLNPHGDNRQQTVVAGKAPPVQLKKMLPELRSRLEGGLLAEINPPEQSTKVQIIAASAHEHNVSIPDDVAFFLASASKDLKTLHQYLTALETYASLHPGSPVELSTVKWIIHNKRAEKVTVNDIQRLSAEYFNITAANLLSNKKDREFSYPRQLAMYLSRKLTDASYKEIGKAFGNKDHSTVIYAVKRIEAERIKKSKVREDVLRIEKLLV